MSKKYYNTKSTLILQNYKPEDIQKLLDSGEFKSAVAHTLGVHIKAFNEYIQKYGLTYQYSRKSKSTQKYNRKQEKQYEKRIPVKDLNSEEAADPLKKFYEMLARKKEKRALRELKNPYDW
jgi:hypothetical protein